MWVLLNIICSPLALPGHVCSDSPVFVPQRHQPHRFSCLCDQLASESCPAKKWASHWGAESRRSLASQMSHLIPAQTPERAKQLATESSQRWHTCYYSSASLSLSVHISVLNQWRCRSSFCGVKGCSEIPEDWRCILTGGWCSTCCHTIFRCYSLNDRLVS